jgi:hypothetical protein
MLVGDMILGISTYEGPPVCFKSGALLPKKVFLCVSEYHLIDSGKVVAAIGSRDGNVP